MEIILFYIESSRLYRKRHSFTRCFKLFVIQYFDRLEYLWVFMVSIMAKQPLDLDLELYEIVFPGKLVGKAVIDANARMIGVIRNIRIQIPSSNIILVVKGLDTEFTVNSNDIQAIGNIVQLNVTIKHSEPIEINDIIRLRNEIQEEIIHFFQVIQSRK